MCWYSARNLPLVVNFCVIQYVSSTPSKLYSLQSLKISSTITPDSSQAPCSSSQRVRSASFSIFMHPRLFPSEVGLMKKGPVDFKRRDSSACECVTLKYGFL